MIILDVICAILTLLAITYIPKNRIWWLVYALGAFLYLFVRLSAQQWGSVIVEVVAIVIGIKNSLGGK